MLTQAKPFSSGRSLRVISSIAAAAALLTTAGCAFSKEEYPKAIQQAVDAGVKVVRSFPAASGLTGWVLAQDSHYSIVYTTADKKTLLAGALINENGESLTPQYEDKYVPKPDFAALFQKLEKSTFVTEGTSKNPKNVIYVFVDPNCPFCHSAWKALQPYEKAGLQVRWIPVAMLGPTSMPKALEVLSAKDRTAAFRKMEESHGKPWTPSARLAEDESVELEKTVRQNEDLMAAFGVNGTPGIVWKDKAGTVRVKAGMPRLSELPAITGLPMQDLDDPELARFR